MFLQKFYHFFFHRFSPAHLRKGIFAVALLALVFAPLSAAHSASTTPSPIHSTQLTLVDLPDEAQSAISVVIGRDQAAYHAACADDGRLAFDNPAHNLYAAFSADAATLSAGSLEWNLRLMAWGYGDALQEVEYVAPTAQANRVTYRRARLTEWYVNGPQGLEQGFTLHAPPSERQGEALTLTLALPAGFSARVDENRAGLAFLGREGALALIYSGLAAYDADGQALPAWMYVTGDSLRLNVMDAGARYPITVDPFVQQAKLTATDGAANDQFGYSVSISGDGNTLVVGAVDDQGSAYVFVKPDGGWTGNLTQAAKLTASDGAAGDSFGQSVSISGDGNTLVVGANADGGYSEQGMAYVFVKPGGGWTGNLTQAAKLFASDGAASDHLGNSVSISSDGNTVVVGAVGDDIGANSDQGSAYVFVKPGGGWATMPQTAKLFASDGAAYDYFGRSVSISSDGNTVVVGADRGNVGANADQGSAYGFVKSGGGWTGNLTQTAKLTASDGAAADYFGQSVSISGEGNTVVVGAYSDDISANADQGSAYVFVKPGGGWTMMTQTAKLAASDGAAYDYFGQSVSISGDGNTVVVGADWNDISAKSNQGSAYVFVKPVGGWATMTQSAKLTASDGAANDQFGYSVSISGAGNTIAGGAYKDDIGFTDRGSAYVFEIIDTTCQVYLPLALRR